MNIDGYSILNLNDCIISSDKDFEHIASFLSNLRVENLDIPFTHLDTLVGMEMKKISNLEK